MKISHLDSILPFSSTQDLRFATNGDIGFLAIIFDRFGLLLGANFRLIDVSKSEVILVTDSNLSESAKNRQAEAQIKAHDEDQVIEDEICSVTFALKSGELLMIEAEHFCAEKYDNYPSKPSNGYPGGKSSVTQRDSLHRCSNSELHDATKFLRDVVIATVGSDLTTSGYLNVVPNGEAERSETNLKQPDASFHINLLKCNELDAKTRVELASEHEQHSIPTPCGRPTVSAIGARTFAELAAEHETPAYSYVGISKSRIVIDAKTAVELAREHEQKSR